MAALTADMFGEPRRPGRPAPAKRGRPVHAKPDRTPCSVCGQPAAVKRDKCIGCGSVVDGLARLKERNPDAYRAFVASLR